LAKKSFANLKYKFDNTMSKGLSPLVALLSIITALFIVTISVLVAMFGLFPDGKTLSFGEVVWESLLRTLDPGTIGQDTGIGFRVAMLSVTLFGIILVAALIGIISNALNTRLEQLSKGKSKVIENNHTIILGWNSKGVQLIRELVLSNGLSQKLAIVVLADIDKVQLEDEITSRVGHLGKTKIVVRSGSPMSRTDLTIVSLNTAKAVVILSPDFDDDADTFSIKTCLAIKSVDGSARSTLSIVGELRNYSNLEAAELVSEGAVHWVLGAQIINSLIAQTCRQSGLSSVFTNLLDFSGSEIYFTSSEKFKDLTYGELSLMLQTSAAIGLMRDGEVKLSPPADFALQGSDSLIVVAVDGNILGFEAKADVQEDAIIRNASFASSIESTLILGYSSCLDVLISELDKDSTPGSSIVVVAPNIPSLNIQTTNVELTLVSEEPTNRKVLEAVGVLDFDHIIIIANRDLLDVQHSDAKTIHALLQVRSMTNGKSRANIVSEILDDHNRELAEDHKADDFIVSDKIVSHVIAQIAVNKHLSVVFNALFSSAEKGISMVPVDDFVRTGVPVTFNTLVASALRTGKSAIGYRLESMKNEAGSRNGVRLNPARESSITFSPGDTLIVLGE
jgi:voltage-gated potassium channel Kch